MYREKLYLWIYQTSMEHKKNFMAKIMDIVAQISLLVFCQHRLQIVFSIIRMNEIDFNIDSHQ